MRRSQRLIAATVLIALSGALAGCSSIYSWDPSDLLDFLDTKKKLPGERKPVFPDGVPGLEQGVPKELYKGNVEQQQQEQAAQAAAAAAAPPPEPPKPKHAGKSRAKGHPPATASTEPAAAPERGWLYRCGAAGSEAEENRAQAHHRAATRSNRRATGAACSIGADRAAATISAAVPGAAAERYPDAVEMDLS